RHEGVAGWAPLLEVSVSAAEAFEVCDLAFDADTEAQRSDGLREEPFISIRFDRGEKNAAESIAGRTTTVFDLVDCHLARPRNLGPDKNGALVLDAATGELVAREALMPSNRSDDAPVAFRFSALGGDQRAQVKGTLMTTAGKVSFRGRTPPAGSWGFFEEVPEIDVAIRAAFKQRLTKILFGLGGDGSARSGLQIDDVEVFFWVR
ncbi:MAG: hypothetical protein ACAI25_09305, partial [Planctomycetota bacterium]